MSLKTKKSRKLSPSVTPSPLAGRIGSPDALSRWALTGGAGLIGLAALSAWHNSFFGPFVLDDRSSIVSNPTIRRLGHVWEALSARHPGLTVSGRPIVNFSLAINYALSGTEVWSYHALNLAIHILAGLTLFGIVRRTLQKPLLREQFGAAALPLALAVAGLWTLHPLQTEAVTYVVQRVESLMGLFYLLTLYCFIRGTESPRPAGWQAVSVVACLFGMASKEVMVSAPLMVLLYDRTFVAGSFRKAVQQRWRLYAGLAATWGLLAALVAAAAGRGGSAGFGSSITWWQYALTQCQAIVLYLRLAYWPNPLVFDYGIVIVKDALAVAPQGLVLAALLTGTVIALWRRPTLGFLGVWFFLILAPSSSIVPVVTQTIAEHRMYLSLAAVVVVVVAGVFRLLGPRSMPVFAALAFGLGWATVQRNADYRSEFAIWSDTVNKRPDNARAYDVLGSLWLKQGNRDEATRCLTRALELQPFYASAHYNLGIALAESGRPSEAAEHFEEALHLEPDLTDAQVNLGNALVQAGRAADAIRHYEAALQLEPGAADVHINLGLALAKLGRLEEAVGHYEKALRLQPDNAETHLKLANTLAAAGRAPEALEQYEETLRLRPEYAEALNDFGLALARMGRLQEAIIRFAQAVRIKPDYAVAHLNLGVALLQLHRVAEAIVHLEQAVRIDPNLTQAREILARLKTLPQTEIPGKQQNNTKTQGL